MGGALENKPLSVAQRRAQRAAYFNATAIRLWRASLAVMKAHRPVGGGFAKYDREAHVRLAVAADAMTEAMEKAATWSEDGKK